MARPDSSERLNAAAGRLERIAQRNERAQLRFSSFQVATRRTTNFLVRQQRACLTECPKPGQTVKFDVMIGEEAAAAS
jgi:hypothetical protein